MKNSESEKGKELEKLKKKSGRKIIIYLNFFFYILRIGYIYLRKIINILIYTRSFEQYNFLQKSFFVEPKITEIFKSPQFN